MAEVFERRMYRDPLEVLLAIENGSCAGCRFELTQWGGQYCDRGQQYGRKCKLYDEGEVKSDC